MLLETAQHPSAAERHVLAESLPVGPALRQLAPCDLWDLECQGDADEHQQAQLLPHDRSLRPFAVSLPAGATYTDAEVSLKWRFETAAWNESDGSGSHATRREPRNEWNASRCSPHAGSGHLGRRAAAQARRRRHRGAHDGDPV